MMFCGKQKVWAPGNADGKRGIRLLQLKEDLAHYPGLLKRVFIEKSTASSVAQASDLVNDGSTHVRVMQFNALANALCCGSDNFVRCPPEALEWSFRRLRILEELLTYAADVICLQEIDNFDFFRNELEQLGYHGLWFPKPYSPCLDVPGNTGADGCAIFYMASRFSEIGRDLVVIKAADLPTNQVLVSVLLKDRASGHCFCVAVTHLKACARYKSLRTQEGCFILSRLATFVPPDTPLVVCGDFNAPPTEPVVELFSSSDLHISSAYASATGSEPEYTTWKYRGREGGSIVEECHTLDYIWFSQSFIKVKAVLGLPSSKDVGVDLLPSLAYASDHLSLVADLLLLPPSTDNPVQARDTPSLQLMPSSTGSPG